MSSEALAYSTYIMASYAAVLSTLGLFGNVNLLWMTIRKKSMHTKPGILLGINAFFHIICLISEDINATLSLLVQPISRRSCYQFLFLYIFVLCQQTVIMLIISMDLLIALMFPIWYRLCQTVVYIPICLAISTTYALPITVWGWIAARDEDFILFCNPPLVLAPSVAEVWSTSTLVINSAVVVVYVSIILTMHCRKNSMETHESRRVVRRLKVIALVFICSWYMAILGVNVGEAFGLSPDGLMIFQSNMLIFALLTYTQTFYVCIWRSKEYRAAFKEQVVMMRCKTSPVTMNNSQTSKFLTVVNAK
ncbi:hypothetical protein Q1695_005703 [Nippostrongylus brasiliensis]|nr:hypothetical protein Q1695_005703 [Nippostrongylus brasiliensis]